jgi:class 3 adenylate cyclase/tetratricopeptide (TPR) repeat protein
VLVCASCGQETPGGFPRCANCGAPLVDESAPREVRKTVTIVFCDVSGSTALGESTDPEALRALLARYFERMKATVERHGGTVEKFIGDAVMAVFGVPIVHEDDALRACRAAVEMRDALPELGITARIGVNTGEVVTGTTERLATGDAVNVAARLEQAAQPGEVLIGGSTYRLVAPAVEAEPVDALQLKGKAEAVPAFRLVAVTGELERRFGTPMVGRDRELRSLRDALARAVADRSCQLFTVLGSAGVGKSRLAAEFLVGTEARVVRARCLSYGEGITYWPVVEVLKQLGTLPDDETAAEPLRSLLGESGVRPATADEIAWAFRKLLEQEAQHEPIVCVFDDLHWAEQTLFELIESAAELARDAPILFLCMGRPELVELRPGWGGGMWNATTVLLEPLDAGETAQLLDALGGVDTALATRIAAAADGNPLFLEEMLTLVRDSADGRVEVPPTIQALLAARLDQLDASEREVLERGSIEGQVFHRASVEALADGEPQGERLLALVRKQLVRPDRPQLPREDAYRFRHLLIRDAAYDALPKSVRADLHGRFAAWLEIHGQDLVELEEIAGYHFEQAARYLAELGRPDPDVAAAAMRRLWNAGRRALWRADRRAARSLLERAAALSEHPDVRLLVEVARSMDDPRVSVTLLDETVARAEADGDRVGASLARAQAAYDRLHLGATSDEQERLALEAVELLEGAGDDAGLCEVWSMLANGAYNVRCRYDDIERASGEALRYAARAGQQRPHLFMLPVALIYGPRPVRDALARLAEVATDRTHPFTMFDRAHLLAMDGRIDEALALAATAEEHHRDVGVEGIVHAQLADLAAIMGDHEAAVEHLRLYCAELSEKGHASLLSTYAPLLGRHLCALGRFDEAEPLAEQGRELGHEDDPVTQSLWRRVFARVRAHRGEFDDAESLAREALAIAQTTDSPWFRGDTYCDLAEVLDLAGRSDEAAAAFHSALDCYERKGIVPLAARVRERMATGRAL